MFWKKIKTLFLKMKCCFPQKKQNEFTIFVQRNKIHFLLTLVCLIIIIKQSSAPFCWEYNKITEVLFMKPIDGTGLGETLSVLYNLGLAYISSLIFYLLVDYFPKRRKEKNAFIQIENHLEIIDMLINRLFSYLAFIAGMGSSPSEMMPSEIIQLHHIRLHNKQRPCHTIDTNLQLGEVEMEGNPDYINEFYSVRETSAHILESVDTIMGLPCSCNIENYIIEILGVIKNSRMIQLLSSMPESAVKDENMAYICNYNQYDIYEVVYALSCLRRYEYAKHSFYTGEAAEEKIKDAQKMWEKLQNNTPGISSE